MDYSLISRCLVIDVIDHRLVLSGILCQVCLLPSCEENKRQTDLTDYCIAFNRWNHLQGS